MKEQRLVRGDFTLYAGNTAHAEFPDKFQFNHPHIYSSVGYGSATTYIKMSDINTIIDMLTEFRDQIDHEQAAESGDYDAAMS